VYGNFYFFSKGFHIFMTLAVTNLKFTRPGDPAPTQPNALPDLFTAVREQHGLELQPTARRIETLVSIDHIERSAPN
jgi:uncharacterized protein (TIGR03435 family)